MLKSVQEKHIGENTRDKLIRIALLCSETDISDFIDTVDDMQELFSKFSPDVKALFDSATLQTNYCRKIDRLKWYPKDEKIALRSD